MTGKKKAAIIISAVCTMCILLISISAATIEIYHPPVASVTPNTRYSASAGGYITDTSTCAVTVPLPQNKNIDCTIDIGTTGNGFYGAYFITLGYDVVVAKNFDLSLGYVSVPLSEIPDDAVFYVLRALPDMIDHIQVSVNGEQIDTVIGDYTLAHQGYYEIVEVPDEPDDNSITNNVLGFWREAIELCVPNAIELHDSMIEPLSIVFAVSSSLILISILFKMIGGK